MSDPLNPYSPPLLPADDVVVRPDPPPRLDNRFADAFLTGTRLLTRNFLLVTAIVLTVWLPINLWISYYELFVIAENDFRSYLRMVRLMEGLFGVLGVGAITAVGVVELSGQTPSFNRAFGESFPQWGTFVLAGIAGSFLLVLGLLLFIVPGLYVLACLVYLAPVLIVERLGVVDTLKQCFATGRRQFWFSLGLMLSISILQFVTGVAGGIVSGAFSLLELPEGIYWVVNALVSLPADLVGAWGALVVVAAYLRLRDEAKAEVDKADAPGTASRDDAMPDVSG